MLGLAQGSPVHEHHFVTMLAGLDPNSGEQYIKSGYTRDGVEAHKAGLELAYSPPKSVSVLGEFSGEELKGKIWEAFKDAVKTSLQYAETELSQVRQKINGEAVRFDSGNLAVAMFDDTTARPTRAEDGSILPGDMQWHSHDLVMNMSKRESDGKIVALENRAIFQNRRLLDEIFQNELAANIRELGFSIDRNERGHFEIAGIPNEVLQQFSKRRADIIEKAEEIGNSAQALGKNDGEIRQLANLASREKKADFTYEEHKSSWEKQLNDLGYTREQIVEKAQDAGREYNAEQSLSAKEYVQYAASALTENQATFSRAELLKTAAMLATGNHRTAEIGLAITELTKSAELVALTVQSKDTTSILTTPEMHRMELEAISLVRDGHGKETAFMTHDNAAMAIANYEEFKRSESPEFSELTVDQRKTVQGILASEDRTILVQGAAGSGKSASFDAIRFAMEANSHQDIKIIGLAPTGKAASALQHSAGIQSMTMDSYIQSVSDQNAPSSGENTLLIVDEAAMVGTKLMHSILKHAEETGARVVLSGDISQLAPVSAGRPFQEMQEVFPVLELNEVLRQKTDCLKAIRDDVSDKRIDSAFDKLDSAGRLYEISDRTEAVKLITDIYSRNESWQERLVITNTNADRQELNESIRQALKNNGEIGQEDISLTVRFPKNIPTAEKHFAEAYNQGDYLFANAAGGGLRAGAEFQVRNIDSIQNTLLLDDGNGNLKILDLQRYGQGVSAYSEQSKPFTEDEKIVFLKNDRKIGVMNGETAFIRSVDENGNITVEKADGNELSFNTKEFSYFDHGNAITLTKAQGMTASEVTFWANSDVGQMNSTNTLYTAVTRGQNEIHLITNDRTALLEQFENASEKSSVFDYVKHEAMEPEQPSPELHYENLSFSLENLQPDITELHSIENNSTEQSLIY